MHQRWSRQQIPGKCQEPRGWCWSGHPNPRTLARKIDAYHLALASLQRHTLECLETLDRTIHIIHALDINLRYFGTLSLARILQGEHQLVISSLAATLLALHLHQGRLAVLESGITQTVTEWEQRLTLEITIGTILHRIIEEIWKIVHTLIEGNRKLARWIHLAKENLSYSLTTPFTRIPCLKDCLGISVSGTMAMAHPEQLTKTTRLPA